MTVSFTVEAPELARALSNALAFIPAASRIQVIYVETRDTGELVIIGTDTYAAGMESIQTDYRGNPAALVMEKVDAVELEKAVRKAGKVSATVTLKLSGFEVDMMGSDIITAPVAYQHPSMSTFDAVVDLFEVVERRRHAIPGVICLDPSLLSRFSKVKTDKAYGRMADCLFGEDELDKVLIKIGPSFKGLIMPIDREVNGTNVGSDGLW